MLALNQRRTQNSLFLHAVVGCDTTSRLHGIRKGASLKKYQTNNAFREQAKVLHKHSASTHDVTIARERTLVILGNGRSIDIGGGGSSGLERWTGDRVVLGSNPAAATSHRNFGNSVHPALPVSFGWYTKSCWSLLSGVYARGSKMSHQSALEMCNLSWTPHLSLEKDNSLNYSCVSPEMGCLEYT